MGHRAVGAPRGETGILRGEAGSRGSDLPGGCTPGPQSLIVTSLGHPPRLRVRKTGVMAASARSQGDSLSGMEAAGLVNSHPKKGAFSELLFNPVGYSGPLGK